MASDPIPVIEIRGTHREAGGQIGEAMRGPIQHTVEQLRDWLPAGVSWEVMQDKGRLCLTHSRAVYPQYVDELEGLAEGADVPFEHVFTAMCEELWSRTAWVKGSALNQLKGGVLSTRFAQGAAQSLSKGGVLSLSRGCTDMAARGRATTNGATLLAHTNDLDPDAEESLVILKVQAGDEPEFLGVSPGGLGYSAGFNAAGISLTGNEVGSNDVRPGVPRMLIVRAILAARRLEEAMDACLLPGRASNYNNIIADAHGEVYSMEGSATDCEPIYIEGDILAHANHYVSGPMRRFEADPADNSGSIIRHNRAMRLLRENYGQLSPALFRSLLADHANYPASICKHGVTSVTVFSMIVNLNELRAWIGRGRPCQTTYVEHTLESWIPPEDWKK